MPGTFDESKHPRAPDGKFGSGPGGASSRAAGDDKDPDKRASDAVRDREFVGRHSTRLGRAANAAGAGDAAHPDAQAAIRDEIKRIHVEDDAASDSDRIREVLEDARSSSGDHEAVMSAVQAERSAIDNETRALEAGDITRPPTKVLDKIKAEMPKALAEVDEVRESIQSGGQGALDAIRNLKAIEITDPDTGRSTFESIDFASLEEDIAGSVEEVGGEVTDSGDRDIFDDADLLEGEKPDDPEYYEPDPDYEEDEYEADPDLSDEENAEARRSFEQLAREQTEDRKREVAVHAEKLKEYNAWNDAKARHEAEVVSRATQAQDALEDLHERQVRSAKRISELDSKLGKMFDAAEEELADLDDDGLINQEAFSDHERDDEGEIVDATARARYDASSRASASLLAATHRERERLAESIRITDATDSLKMTANDVARAIKNLAKITGRSPKLSGKSAAKKPAAKKPTKTKKSNRPDAGQAATVVGMARHRLRLSKLQFVSLVDRPAQETATVRLIKRAGAEDRVQARATAKLVKLADGPSPLAYFWAFTCTDENGAPYHDLQGDAVAPDAYIKAAEEFMAEGGAVDDMHNGVASSRVAFAFPMDSDIASGMFGSAIGKQVKTSGLMIAIRPSPTELAMLKSGERTGVSIAGLGVREALEKGMPPWMKGKDKKGKKPGDKKKPRRYGKSAVLTSLEAGHQHTIDLEAPCSHWGDSYSTSHQTAEGAEQAHCHAWVYDPMTGAISIAADSGHTHTVDAVVSAETMAEAMREDEHDEMPCVAPCSEPASGASVVVVSARAPGISTPSDEAATVTQQEQQMATDQDKIAELTKTVERLTALASLTDLQKAYHATLNGTEAVAFLAKSAVERAAAAEPFEIAKRAEQEIVYTTKAGEHFRKSDDPRLVAMAKRADAAEAAGEQVTLEKRASADLSHFAKGLNVTAAIVKAVDGIPDEAVRKEAHEAIRGANNALKQLGKAHGHNPGADPVSDDPAAKLDALAKKHAADNKVPFAKAYDAVMSTAEGAALYTAISTPRAN